METRTVTFEYDPNQVFDTVAKVKDGGAALGQRMVGVLLGGIDNVGMADILGMAFYGVSIVRKPAAAPETATQRDELLEALKQMVQAATYGTFDHADSHPLPLARSAIARATGASS